MDGGPLRTADAPVPGTVVSVSVQPGSVVGRTTVVVVLEVMKMEHHVEAGVDGTVSAVHVGRGDTVAAGQPLVAIAAGGTAVDARPATVDEDLGAIRPDLAEVLARTARTTDAQRLDAVARRHAMGRRTARENLADLVDEGSFIEYGALVVAAQRSRRDVEELMTRTPADGIIGGTARVDGVACAVVSYDYTVLAGTQGWQGHRKKDRLFDVIERLRLPVVLFAEGGGGRPGDTDPPGVAALDCMAFALWARLSGAVPLIGIAAGFCFAGNAALLGCCDVIIATTDANIGMGGPAMIEGGRLGVHDPTAIGPLEVQVTSGVVDIAVADEAEAVRAAKRYLAYFAGPAPEWTCTDQRVLRRLVPANRRLAYDVRAVIDAMADVDSVLELRRGFGDGMVTALARVEGAPLGVIANNPEHLGGAIDRDAADKAARFMQLCDAFGLPVLFLCDTPGFMVGPEAEETGQVRHFARMFVTGARLRVPFFTIVLRKGYGLGAQAMAGGSFHAPLFTVSWPTGEFGGMNLEGAVRLGFRRELEAIADPDGRAAAFDRLVAAAHERGRALNVATYFEIDDVIDPAESRRLIANTIRAAPRRIRPSRRPLIDPW